MKLFKALSNTIRNALGFVDNAVLGLTNLSLIWVDVTDAARKEQILESATDLKAMAAASGMPVKDIEKLMAAI